jgi:hypothetical protein
MNTDYLTDVKLAFWDDKIIMTYVSVAQTEKIFDKQLVWDLKLPSKGGIPISAGQWTFNMGAMLPIGRDFYFASSTEGKVFAFDDTYNRNGEAIHAIYETIADPLNGDSQQYKSLRFVDYEFTNILGSVDVTIEGQTNSGVLVDVAKFTIGSKAQTGLWNECVWNVSQFNAIIEGLEVPDYARNRQSVPPITAQTFKLIVENDTIDETFTLSSLAFAYTEKDKRRYNPNFVN